jgi:hypothetical protein
MNSVILLQYLTIFQCYGSQTFSKIIQLFLKSLNHFYVLRIMQLGQRARGSIGCACGTEPSWGAGLRRTELRARGCLIRLARSVWVDYR